VDRPQHRKLAAIRSEIGLLRAEVAAEQARAGDLGALSERIRQAEAALGEFQRRVPRTAELGEFVAELSEIGVRVGLRDQNLAPLSPEPRNPLVIQPIRIEFLAEFDAAFEFLRAVEGMPRVARVSEMKLAHPEPFRGELRAEMIIQVFYEAA
jgi:Tfp pilus assembly protein PilO